MIAVMVQLITAKKSEKNADQCIALAMSGGGTLGAYEAGAVYGLYHASEDKTKFEYDVITGVSAGSINLGAMALFDIGDEENMLDVISDTWQSMSTPQLYANWKPLGIVTGVLQKTGVLDTAPLETFITNFFNKYGGVLKRRVVVSAVDTNTGAYLNFNETEPEFVHAMMSSSAIPFVFPNQKWP
jgi:predicted acylesterase/phospholipase RssA